MNIVYDSEVLLKGFNNLHKNIKAERKEYYMLINLIVGLHTTYRLAKDYATSDKIREVLNQSGIKIIQGTVGYTYEDIPEKLKGRQYQDTWYFTKKVKDE